MAKKKVKNKIPSKRWKKYTIVNDKLSKKRFCPKCGDGFFLAEHKDRFYCGYCHYFEKK